MNNINNRVVVTGIGVLSPMGLDLASNWQNLIAGKSGIDHITLFDASSLETRIGGEVKGFEPTNYMDRKDARRNDRFTQLAVAASQEAVKHSGIQFSASNPYQVAVVIGSGIGGLTTLFEQIKVLIEKGPGRLSPFLAPMMMPDMAAAQVSITLGLKGPNLCITSACSSSSDAIGIAYEAIKHGNAEIALAGGSEATINPIGVAAFNAMRAISTRNDAPQLASRPFDAERNGFVISEGACLLVLESLAHARKRGANILAEVIAYGATADAFHITQPAEDGAGAAQAMRLALDRAQLTPTDIDYINAHGTSTPLNDKIETKAIKSIFGTQAYRIPISSTKSMTGHLIGAAGAFEAMVCIMTIQHGIIPPTINLTHPDPECDLDYVPNVARQAKVNTAMSNSFGFGGHNSVLILRRYTEV